MALHVVLKRSFPIALVLLVATAAYFQARGMARLLGAALERSFAPSVPVGAPPAPVAPAGSSSAPDAAALAPPARAVASDPLSWPDCEGIQVVIVTESSDPWWSRTTLREPGDAHGRLRRVGDAVAGKQVAFIGYNPRQQAPSVWLEGRGASCQSTLVRKPPNASAPNRPTAAVPSVLNVERGVVESTLQDYRSTLRHVRVVPDRKDGQVVGLRLLGIRPGSLLATLGLQNGDRLEAINGFSLASPEKALEAYARLRTATRLNVRLQRAGKPLEILLNIN